MTQLVPILGLERVMAHSKHPVETPLEKLRFVFRHIQYTHKLTLVVSLVALALLVFMKLFKHKLVKRKGFTWLAYFPEVLFVVIVSTSTFRFCLSAMAEC